MEISEQMAEKKELRQAMMFLTQYGISMSLAVKIYQEYGPKTYQVVQEITENTPTQVSSSSSVTI